MWTWLIWLIIVANFRLMSTGSEKNIGLHNMQNSFSSWGTVSRSTRILLHSVKYVNFFLAKNCFDYLYSSGSVSCVLLKFSAFGSIISNLRSFLQRQWQDSPREYLQNRCMYSRLLVEWFNFLLLKILWHWNMLGKHHFDSFRFRGLLWRRFCFFVWVFRDAV